MSGTFPLLRGTGDAAGGLGSAGESRNCIMNGSASEPGVITAVVSISNIAPVISVVAFFGLLRFEFWMQWDISLRCRW